MKTKFISNLSKPINLLLLMLVLGMAACTDDDDDSVNNQPGVSANEEELITTVVIKVKDTLTDVEQTFRWTDPDGDGGNDPSIDTITLAPNTFYEVEIEFLDESDPSDVEDITEEIEDEDDEHLICYTSSPQTMLNVLRTDSDGTYEVGLESTWESFTAQNGSLKIVLKHQPGVKDGSCSPGETDIEIDLPVFVQ